MKFWTHGCRLFVGLLLLSLAATACNNIVPPKEAAAFAHRQQEREWYRQLTEDFVYMHTDAGDMAIQLLPLKDRSLLQKVRSLVKAKYYDGLRFHRAITSPIPFGVQVGDPVTRGRYGREFVWEGVFDSPGVVPVAGSDPGPVTKGTFVSEYPYTKGAVSLSSNQGGRVLSSHLFFHLADNSFVDKTHPVIGYVRFGQSTLDNITLGTRIIRARLLSLSEFPDSLTSMEVSMPRNMMQSIKRANPDG